MRETERVDKGIDDDEAIRVALKENTGLLWLCKQCKQNLSLQILLLNQAP